MRVLGLDMGDVRIGVAVSDPSRIIAQGLDFIKRVDPKSDVEAIKRLVNEHEAAEIVIGLPKMLSGEIGIQAQKALDFAELLKPLEIPVIMWDERMTTVAATRTLIEANVRRKKRKKVVDKVAAVLILQGYLDSL